MGELVKPKINAMIKPVHGCNMNCDYCFVGDYIKKYGNQKMSMDTLNQTFKILSNSAKEVNIIWHGGEPTLMGPQWYKDAVELSFLYSDKTKFSHALQTNGLLLNDEGWADLVNNYGFDISVSFDGLFQDFRKKGTKEIVESNILKFKERVGRVGCLSVITKNSYEHMIDNYEYFKKINLPVSFNYGINDNPDSTSDYDDIPLNDYMKHYLKYFKHWLKDKDGFRERSCVTPIKIVFGIGGECCSTSDCRFRWVNINPDGSTSHCNRYFPKEYGMGSIEDITYVDELYQTEGYKKFNEAIEKRFANDCFKCSYVKYCNGGCNSTHLMNAGGMDTVDEAFCNRFKEEFDQVYKILRNIDINVNDNLNPYFLDIINQGVFTVKEIKNYLEKIGIDHRTLEYNPENLIECKEFRVFREFNPIRNTAHNHMDYFDFPKLSFGELKNITTNEEFRTKRFGELDYIFNQKSGNILNIIKG